MDIETAFDNVLWAAEYAATQLNKTGYPNDAIISDETITAINKLKKVKALMATISELINND